MGRCSWVGSDKIYLDYHDKEWGIPEYDSRALWEKLILDGFQAGLSWITILKKRDAFRLAFAGFEPGIIAQWGTKEVDLLLKNVNIVRHRGKIEATIGNAKAFNQLETEMPFSDRMSAARNDSNTIEPVAMIVRSSPFRRKIPFPREKA